MSVHMRFIDTRRMFVPVVACSLAMVLSWGFLTPAAAFTPQQNTNGVSWVSASAEAWSGSGQVGPSGSTVHLAGAFDSSVDTTDGAGVVAYIGLLDPIGPGEEATPTPTGGEPSVTPTPTATGGEPEVTSTPTATDGEPEVTPTPTATGEEPGKTPTPTQCEVASDDADYDLNGDEIIDARDLLLLIEAIDAGDGNPYDLNCDGVTNDLDLVQFSGVWKVDLPL